MYALSSLMYALSSLIEPSQGHATELALHKAFALLGCDIRTGTSQASQAEKKLQVDIDALKKELGKPVRPTQA